MPAEAKPQGVNVFQVGHIRCIALADGTFTYPANVSFRDDQRLPQPSA